MNVISGYRAYSVYPHLTFHKRVGVLLGQYKERNSLPSLVSATLDKVLEARGYRTIQGYDLQREVGVPREVSRGRRFCGDEHCLVLDFEPETWSPELYPHLQHHSWNLVIHAARPSRPFFNIESYRDYSPAPFVYTTGFNTVDSSQDIDAFVDGSFMKYWGPKQFELDQYDSD